ncbi:MAG: 16S rRNA (adenine(1518)-N(6)/adenine(1519)-N(6))-dimethyltransferase RsmA [Rickettsiales bacterium]|jgi:16S rRNA (adenine1518-N6/adenine1519-N6)-dimethyltransferase|nr:16S rRNA (adenine(1518)-N(6)/adenine(1519)-N(6))-dimethyltransferase RsmA [Rickettsiales bacterium]
MVDAPYNVLNILKKYNLVAKKRFGQNFLVNSDLLSKIANVAQISGKNILEIGPGPGGLTHAILKECPKKLVSIEIDKNYFNILKNEFIGYNNFEVINNDAVKINESDYFDGNINVIANLPYNVGTHLLLKWLNNIKIYESFTLLLQKEVVDRIIAKPNTKEYGRLSVMAQAITFPKKMFDISPSSFIPSPKVMSSVIHLKPKQTNFSFEKLSKITSVLFANRRKKIRAPIEKLKINVVIDLNKRAEELSVDDFINLSFCL